MRAIRAGTAAGNVSFFARNPERRNGGRSARVHPSCSVVALRDNQALALSKQTAAMKCTHHRVDTRAVGRGRRSGVIHSPRLMLSTQNVPITISKTGTQKSGVVAVLKDKSVDVGRNNNETAVGNDAAHRSFHGECSGGRSATLRQSRRAVVLGRGRRGPHAGVALTLRSVIGILSRTIHLVARRESRTHRGLLQQLLVSYSVRGRRKEDSSTCRVSSSCKCHKRRRGVPF